MPRRYIDNADRFIGWNNIMSYGSWFSILSVLYVCMTLYYSLSKKSLSYNNVYIESTKIV